MLLLLLLLAVMLSVERLGDCYVKVADDRQRYRPMYKTLTSPSVVRYRRPFGVCIFAPSSSDDDDQEQSHRPMCRRAEPPANQPLHRCVQILLDFVSSCS